MGPVGHGDSPLNVFKKNNLENVVSHSWFRVGLKVWFLFRCDAVSTRHRISGKQGGRVITTGRGPCQGHLSLLAFPEAIGPSSPNWMILVELGPYLVPCSNQ